MNSGPHARLNFWIDAFPRVAGATAIVTGAIVIIGWILDVPVLKSLHPELVSMKANAALAFVLGGMSLLLHSARGTGKQRMTARILATMVLLIGLFTVAEYVFTWNAGIDELLFNEPKGTIGKFLPGRMAFDSAMSFCLFGLAILLHNRRSRWSEGAAQVLALVVGAFGLLALVAYLYGLPGISGYAVYMRMALHTSCTFILLSIGFTCLQPNVGVMAVIRGEGSGGFMARRLMPAAVVVPILLCWIVARGEMEGFYGNQFGEVIDATAYVAIALYLIWMIGRSLNKVDAERKKLELSLLKSEREFKELFDNAPVGYHEVDREGAFSRINETELRMLGYQAEEMLGHFAWEFVDNQAESRDALLARLAGKRPRESSVERIIHRKDGTTITAMIEDQVVRDAQDRIVGLRATLQDVTELKRSQELLRESEERWRAVVRTATDAIVTANQKGIVVSWNEAAERIFGYASSAAVGKPVTMIMPERFRESHTIGMNRLVATGNARVVGKTVELTGLRSDGNEFPMELSLTEVKSNGATLFAGIIRDISERKFAEKAVIASELELRRVWEGSFDGMRLVDGQGTILMVNEAYCTMIGKRREELVGKPLSIITVESGQQLMLEKHKQRFASGTIQPRTEKELELWDGRRLWFEVSNSYIESEGQPRRALGIFRDVTERKRVEEALAAERSLLRTLIDNLPDTIYVKDAACRKTLANPVDVRNMGGSSEAEVLGKTDFDFYPRDVAGVFYADDQSVIQSGRPILNREEMITLPDKAIGWQLTSKVPLRDSAGQVIGLVGIGHDITEHKRAEQERESLINELKTALENIRTLAGLVPICSSCKKIRDDKGFWNQLEHYLAEHTDAKFTHGLCPDCAKVYFPGVA